MPLYHLLAFPILSINLFVTGYLFFRNPGWLTGWAVLVALAFVAGFAAVRISTLTIQNRLIRLEMMLRLRGLLPPELMARANELRVGQLVGLRFASDAELPALVQRCLNGELRSSEQIKREIQQWQPDTLRA